MPSAAIFKTSLDLLYYSGASAAFQRVLGGLGAILMLHQVYPGGGRQAGFAPNRGLEVTPEFLDDVLSMLRTRGFDLVNLDEAARRIENAGPPFVALTLDDGYRDNLVHALPVFRKHGCPFTVYVAPAITDGTCEIWWKALEEAIARTDELKVSLGGLKLTVPCATESEKWAAWHQLYWPVRNMEQHQQRQWMRDFAEAQGIDLGALCRDLAMDWDEVRQIAADPLCSIGAHTINHFAVKALSAEECLAEMQHSAARIEQELGVRPTHFAYPYGDENSAGPRDFNIARQAGFTTAVTTRKGLLYPQHRDHLTGLPRLSLAGEYQNLRHVKTLLSGVPFALYNRFRLVNVA